MDKHQGQQAAGRDRITMMTENEKKEIVSEVIKEAVPVIVKDILAELEKGKEPEQETPQGTDYPMLVKDAMK